MKRYFLLPFKSTPLILMAVFSFGLYLAIKSRLTGIPMAALIISWFFKYCFVLFDSVVAGEDEPPVLEIEMVNPVSEQRPLVMGALLVAEGMLVNALQARVGVVAGFAAAIGSTALLPANIAVFGYTRNIFEAVWPPALISLIRRLGRDYALINAVMVASVCTIYWVVIHGIPLFYALFVAQAVLLLTFSVVGGAMFEHRHDLGIDSKTRQERLAERDARDHQAERARMLDHAYYSFQVRKPREGWQQIESWLRTHVQSDQLVAEYRALLEATSKWSDLRAADKLANEFVAHLLSRKQTGEALLVVEQRLLANPLYEVTPESQALRIVELAGAAGKKALQRRVNQRPQIGKI